MPRPKSASPRLFLETAFQSPANELPAEELLTAAAELGISATSLRRAKRELGIRAIKSRRIDGRWMWQWTAPGRDPLPPASVDLGALRAGLNAYGWRERADGQWMHPNEGRTYSTFELLQVTDGMVLTPDGQPMVWHRVWAQLLDRHPSLRSE